MQFWAQDSKAVYKLSDMPQPKQQNDHSVVIVGWGSHPDDTEYWKVKNSWNVNLGDQGFYYVE